MNAALILAGGTDSRFQIPDERSRAMTDSLRVCRINGMGAL